MPGKSNGRIVLEFRHGRNMTTGRPQWQARRNGILYVPHRGHSQPRDNGERWECIPLEQIGPASREGRKGAGVVLVMLLKKEQRPDVVIVQSQRAAT